MVERYEDLRDESILKRARVSPLAVLIAQRSNGSAGTGATDGACKRRAEFSRCGPEREFVGVFQHAYRLLTGHVRKTIEIVVEAEAAFEVGEQTVHRHTRPLKTRRAAEALRINPDRHFRWIAQWQTRFHLVVNVAEGHLLSAANLFA